MKLILKTAFRNIVRMPGRSVLSFLVIVFCVMSMTCGIMLNFSVAGAQSTLENEYLCIAGINKNIIMSDGAVLSGFTTEQIKEIASAEGVRAYNMRYGEGRFSINVNSLHAMPKVSQPKTETPPGRISLTKNYQVVGINNINLEKNFVTDKCEIVSGAEFTPADYSGEDDGAVIPEWMAKELDLRVGDTLCIRRKKANMYDSALFTVRGIYADRSGSLNDENMPAYVTYASLSGAYEPIPYAQDNFLHVDFLLENDGFSDSFVYAIRDLGYDFYTVDLVFNNRTHDIISGELESVHSVTVVILCVLICANLGLLAFFGSLFTATRSGERNILRALGMTKGKIASMLTAEILIILIIAMPVGYFAGTALTDVAAEYVNSSVIKRAEQTAASASSLVSPLDTEKYAPEQTFDISVSRSVPQAEDIYFYGD